MIKEVKASDFGHTAYKGRPSVIRYSVLSVSLCIPTFSGVQKEERKEMSLKSER